MNTKRFLLFQGIIFLVLGLSGLTFMGPTPENSVLGQINWLDETENIAHLTIGVTEVLAYFFLKDVKLTKWLVLLVGVIALVATVAGFLGMGNPVPNAGIANFETSDNIVHLIVTVSAFYVARNEEKK